MSLPVFEEFEPAAGCGCAGCARQRRDRARGLPVRAGGHPAAHGARRALVLMTAAGVVLGGGGAQATASGAVGPVVETTGGQVGLAADRASVPGPDTPQGDAGPLHGGAHGPGPGSRPGPGPQPPSGATPTTDQGSAQSLRTVTRAEIINRAKRWVSAQVPYSMEKYWSDGYRQDCSGYISMAWNLRANEWTGSLDGFAERIDRADLQPGDILLFHNPADPARGSHVTLFGGWTDHTRTSYIAYEQTEPRTRRQATPLAYWVNADRYVAYRYKAVVGGGVDDGGVGDGGVSRGASTTAAPRTAGAAAATAVPYPGEAMFGAGANNAYVTQLRRLLIARGAEQYYGQDPGPRWGEADRRATRAFQRAQGWKGEEADGLPGPRTWRLLVSGQGRSIGGSSGSGGPSTDAQGFPGRGYFRPGQSNAYVEKLGKQLVKRGYGKHYLSGPGPRWGEADRRSVEAFQRAQGWRGGAADGHPGPETWRRLFR
ncbi:peptidoglycan-binding protein [Streptomyces sp. NPDC056222]|uniref:peptidoglycan-binding protein n=1 Tax=Streptomyces sp. NPDC056222 TaxID=3345749 RepID=UPI0035DFACFA